VHLIAVAKKGEWICPYCDEAYDNYKEIIKGE